MIYTNALKQGNPCKYGMLLSVFVNRDLQISCHAEKENTRKSPLHKKRSAGSRNLHIVSSPVCLRQLLIASLGLLSDGLAQYTYLPLASLPRYNIFTSHSSSPVLRKTNWTKFRTEYKNWKMMDIPAEPKEGHLI